MIKNTDPRIVVLDRKQFDALRSHAYHGAHDDDMVEGYEAILRHVHKFNPHVADEDDGEKADELRRRMALAANARRWIHYHGGAYMRGKVARTGSRPQLYLLPVRIIGRALPTSDGNPRVVVELQAHDEDQREAFLVHLRDGLRSYAGQTNQCFTGLPVIGGHGVHFIGEWSERQQHRARRGAEARLYFHTEISHLVDKVPGDYQPCNGLFKGFYFQPSC